MQSVHCSKFIKQTKPQTLIIKKRTYSSKQVVKIISEDTMRSKVTLIMLTIILVAHPIFSDTNSLQDDNEYAEKSFENLLIVMEQSTKIATKTKLNADYVPGMVTVLTGLELSRMGYQFVGESLSLVPGFIRSGGGTTMITRGIGEGFYSGKLKLLLNNVSMNDSLSGECNPIFRIPIKLVKKIEIIRGPGSAIYGEWAYLGVINVITHEDEIISNKNEIFCKYGEYENATIGGNFSYEKDSIGVHLSTAYSQIGETNILAGPDSLYGTPNEPISQAPGPVDTSYDSQISIFTSHYNDVHFLAQFLQVNTGSSHGFMDVLPPYDEDRRDREWYLALQTSWKPKFSRTLSADFHVGYKRHKYNEDDVFLYPPGMTLPTGIIYENGLIGGPHYEESTINVGGELFYSGINKHNILVGLKYNSVHILDNWARRNYELHEDIRGMPGTPLPYPKKFTGDGSWIESNKYRNNFGVFFQDQIEINKNVNLTIGMRHDHYSISGNRFSPRIASVYRLSDIHIFKVQYAEAFRPSTFIEMYSKNNPVIVGNLNISPEIIKTTELGYIYKKGNLVTRITAYYSYLKDLIAQKGNLLDNIGNVYSKGAEVEFRWNINNTLLFNGNCSYTNNKHLETKDKLIGTAPWIGNAGIVYNPLNSKFYLSLQSHYLSERHTEPSKPEFDSQYYFDTAFSIESISGFNMVAIIKNLTDENIRTPSSGYIDGYSWIGRRWMIQFSKSF